MTRIFVIILGIVNPSHTKAVTCKQRASMKFYMRQKSYIYIDRDFYIYRGKNYIYWSKHLYMSGAQTAPQCPSKMKAILAQDSGIPNIHSWKLGQSKGTWHGFLDISSCNSSWHHRVFTSWSYILSGSWTTYWMMPVNITSHLISSSLWYVWRRYWNP